MTNVLFSLWSDVMETLSTSVFRISTYFSAKKNSFFNYSCKTFKVNGIQTILHRTFNVRFTALSFQKEVFFLKFFFSITMGFPISLKLVENHV